jgi:hypothetical protein
MNQFWEMLSSVADVLGVVSALPMLAAAVLFAHRARCYEKVNALILKALA